MDKRRRPRISLDLLRGFRVAARQLSFTRAAEELSVTQSAISHEIKTLEEQIGRPLFVRVHRGLQLTRLGEELYRIADETLAQIDAFAERIAETGETISVTTTSGLASMWLAPDVAGNAGVEAFVEWLWGEVRSDGEFTLATPPNDHRPSDANVRQPVR